MTSYKKIIQQSTQSHSKVSALIIRSSFLSKIFLHYITDGKSSAFILENCKNLNNSKNIGKFFSWLDSTWFWKLKFVFYNDSLNLIGRFFCYFIELLTLGLDNEILGFFEFLLFNFDV